MVTFSYILIWILASALSAVVAFGSHYAHANFAAFGDKLVDTGKISDHVINDVFSPNYSPWGDYDESGWWQFDSFKNYLIHWLPLLIIVQVLMLYNWPGRAQLLQSACEFLTDRDLAPLVCRMI